MRFLTRFYTAILVLVISVLFIVMFLIKDMVLMMDENANLNYIPQNTVFVAKINTAQLIKTSAHELLTTQDPEIKEQFKKLDLKSGNRTFNGINFTSNVYMFIVPFDGEFIEGFLFNLTNKELFQEYYLQEKKYAFAANNEVGVVFLKDLKTGASSNYKKLSALAESIIETPQNKEEIEFSSSNSIISTWSKDVTGGLLYNNHLELAFDKQQISLTGTLNTELSEAKGSNYLKRKGISFNTCLIPQSINDTINQFLHSIGSHDSVSIESFSLNYSGVNFEQTDKLSIIPQVELLINFESAINKDSLLNQLSRNKLIQKSDSSRFIFNEILLNISQPEPNQLLIHTGSIKSNIEVREELLEFSGDPTLLFKVGGNSPYGQFLNFIPIFRSGRQLTAATESVNIQITPGNNGTHQVNGVMKFKVDKSPILELIKFMNNAALLK